MLKKQRQRLELLESLIENLKSFQEGYTPRNLPLVGFLDGLVYQCVQAHLSLGMLERDLRHLVDVLRTDKDTFQGEPLEASYRQIVDNSVQQLLEKDLEQ
jgi:hypothetical protein